VFGVDHCNSLSIRWQLALVLHSLGRHEEALDDIEMLLSVREQLCGAHHPLVLQTASLRARILNALDRKHEALLEAQRLLPLHTRIFGDAHRETVGLTSLVEEAAASA
jgi:eukaryotic-like serine/threonine-protein kinase